MAFGSWLEKKICFYHTQSSPGSKRLQLAKYVTLNFITGSTCIGHYWILILLLSHSETLLHFRLSAVWIHDNTLPYRNLPDTLILFEKVAHTISNKTRQRFYRLASLIMIATDIWFVVSGWWGSFARFKICVFYRIESQIIHFGNKQRDESYNFSWSRLLVLFFLSWRTKNARPCAKPAWWRKILAKTSHWTHGENMNTDSTCNQKVPTKSEEHEKSVWLPLSL